MKLPLAAALRAIFAGNAVAQAPAVDHHQHIFGPEIVALKVGIPLVTGRDVTALLDSAGIRRAVLLSAAYMFGKPTRSVPDEYAKVRAENDWNGAQAAEQPDRLVAFCSVNPLKPYALAEIERCAADPRLRTGLKLHLGNSDVQVNEPAHVAQLQRVFEAANRHHMAIVVHMRASISLKRPYGAHEAQLFLDRVLPFAPDIVVQVAHLAGSGPGYDDPPADSAMAVLAAAVERGDSRTRNLWFDVTSVVDRNITPEHAALVVRRIRQVGVGRVLYGTDAALGDNLRPRESWAAFSRLPLTADERARIAANVAPYLR